MTAAIAEVNAPKKFNKYGSMVSPGMTKRGVMLIPTVMTVMIKFAPIKPKP